MNKLISALSKGQFGGVISPLHKTRGIVHVHGPDTLSFLHGLTTQKIMSKDEAYKGGNICYNAAFLSPKGRVLFDALLYYRATTRSMFIETDHEYIPKLLTHMKRYKVRNDVHFDAEDINKSYKMWSFLATNEEHHKNFVLWFLNTTCSMDVMYYPDPRWPLAFRLISPFDKPAPEIMPQNKTVYNDIDGKLYTWLRMINGISEGSKEIHFDEAIPLECNIDMYDGVSFNKGCYLGQELVARSKHTGVIRKRHIPFISIGNFSDIDKMDQNELFKRIYASKSRLIPYGIEPNDDNSSSFLYDLKTKSPPSDTPIVPLIRTTDGEWKYEKTRRPSIILNSSYNSSMALTRIEHFESSEPFGNLFVTANENGEKTILKAIHPTWYDEEYKKTIADIIA